MSAQDRRTYAREEGKLIRTTKTANGREYTQACTTAEFERFTHAVEEAGKGGFHISRIAEQEDIPRTAADVAATFLVAVGLTVVRRRRHYPTSRDLHLDAMIEYSAPAEVWLERGLSGPRS